MCLIVSGSTREDCVGEAEDDRMKQRVAEGNTNRSSICTDHAGMDTR